ncbi:MarR family winged helix-turn-helix transcriptional regulator [Paenibacillus ginsengarvi]|uniref:MarR family transcriptional regulator n=1 Tax=Paenibacillus ginsengarvi TaxID=400777 RepID=A0A3B0CLF7_9BACL|nr:MarR family transcriptional regulator [Paenibacillus ginsengarvi]RKN85197.1 MarR family transcriptional regulator [Paenibacillus ginsengarvi]
MMPDRAQYAERMVVAMESFRRKWTQIMSARPGYGLTPPQHFMLLLIREQGPCRVTALSERMEVKPSAITSMIDRMVAHQFVDRRPDEKDRRVVQIYLTEQGKQVLAQLDAMRKRTMAQWFESIDAGEAEQFLAILEKLAK